MSISCVTDPQVCAVRLVSWTWLLGAFRDLEEKFSLCDSQLELLVFFKPDVLPEINKEAKILAISSTRREVLFCYISRYVILVI